MKTFNVLALSMCTILALQATPSAAMMRSLVSRSGISLRNTLKKSPLNKRAFSTEFVKEAEIVLPKQPQCLFKTAVKHTIVRPWHYYRSTRISAIADMTGLLTTTSLAAISSMIYVLSDYCRTDDMEHAAFQRELAQQQEEIRQRYAQNPIL